MSKLDDAVSLLRAMPVEQQEIAADALLDFMADNRSLRLTPEQVADVTRRHHDADAPSLTSEEFQTRLRNHHTASW